MKDEFDFQDRIFFIYNYFPTIRISMEYKVPDCRSLYTLNQ